MLRSLPFLLEAVHPCDRLERLLELRKAHLGEVSVTVWPKVLKEMCAKKNIFVLE